MFPHLSARVECDHHGAHRLPAALNMVLSIALLAGDADLNEAATERHMRIPDVAPRHVHSRLVDPLAH